MIVIKYRGRSRISPSSLRLYIESLVTVACVQVYQYMSIIHDGRLCRKCELWAIAFRFESLLVGPKTPMASEYCIYSHL